MRARSCGNSFPSPSEILHLHQDPSPSDHFATGVTSHGGDHNLSEAESSGYDRMCVPAGMLDADLNVG